MKHLLILSASLAGFATLNASGALAAKSPQDFIKDAIQGDNSEIMLGQLAQQKGNSDAVRNFGQTLVKDHSAAKDEAISVAKSLGVTPPDDASPAAEEEKNRLSSTSNQNFDREFAAGMVTDHQKDIQEFQDEASANNGPASAMAAKQLPVLQRHLQIAQSLVAMKPMSTSSNAAGTATTNPGDFIAQEGPDLWRGSKLKGVGIYGPDNAKVGSISDVLMGKDGRAEYIVIGVGGFLGLGQKDVAIPFAQVKFTDQPLPTPARSAAAGNTVSGATGTVGMAPPAPGPGSSADTTGSIAVPAATGPATAPADAAARSTAYPDHGTVDLTADQLKAAPTFQFAK